jgi:RNA polymerase sigma factor (sigma-70 family)
VTGRFQEAEWMLWERACLARIRRGDADAFAELYRAFSGPLYAQILMPRLGQPALAEEALADTFRSALERLDTFRDHRQSIWSWLARIAVNRATDQHRHRARTQVALASFGDLLGAQASPQVDPHDALERAAEQQRLRAAIAATLETIAPRYRRAIELRLVEERERADCAAVLSVTVPTFDVVLLRAVRAFRKAWTEGAAPVQEAVP